jgi:outer membrane murein-binding lipoprotein Lpp
VATTRFDAIATTVGTIVVALLALWATAIQPLREQVERLEGQVSEMRVTVKERSEEAGHLRERVVALEEQQRLREFEILHWRVP